MRGRKRTRKLRVRFEAARTEASRIWISLNRKWRNPANGAEARRQARAAMDELDRQWDGSNRTFYRRFRRSRFGKRIPVGKILRRRELREREAKRRMAAAWYARLFPSWPLSVVHQVVRRERPIPFVTPDEVMTVQIPIRLPCGSVAFRGIMGGPIQEGDPPCSSLPSL